jgi:hypothetical protein
LTGGLVFVGLLQVGSMIWQGISLRQTRGDVHTQAEWMKTQAEYMARESVSMRRQTTLLRKSADAASLNAEILVNSERAWVQVEVIGDADWVKEPGGSTKIWFRPLLKNFGRTPATIESMVVRPHLLPRDESFPDPPLLPPEPDYVSPQSAFTDKHAFLPPVMGINPLAIAINDGDFEAMKKREMFLYVYGKIIYRDISGEGRESRFCNLYWIPPDESHPAQEGFMTTGNTPNAYTECN